MNTKDDPHIVVTGGGRGIGRTLTHALAAEGAAVTCLDIDLPSAEETAEEAAREGSVVMARRCDVTELSDVESSLEQAVATLGPVTGLVANAGGAAGERTPFLQLSEDGWRRMVDRNLTGAFYCALAYGRYLRDAGGGAMVFISSISAERPQPSLAHYSAAKAGLEQLVRVAALELADCGVRVNAVSPGITLTPGNAEIFGAAAVKETEESRIPLGRLGEPADLIGAVSYLLSDRASYVTGTTIVVDGGLTLR